MKKTRESDKAVTTFMREEEHVIVCLKQWLLVQEAKGKLSVFIN
jgi:hypothetical protein